MRHALLFRLAAVSMLFAGSAAAQWVQNMEIALLLGGVPGTSQVLAGSHVKTEGGIANLITYGYQIHSFKPFDLYLELPIGFWFRGNVTVDGAAATNGSSANFFTPGAKFKFHVQQRVAIYGSAGIGWGSFQEYAFGPAGNLSTGGHRSTHLVGEFGGGVDFRVTTMLSLRAEARDLVTARDLDGTHSRHRPLYAFGFAMHF